MADARQPRAAAPIAGTLAEPNTLKGLTNTKIRNLEYASAKMKGRWQKYIQKTGSSMTYDRWHNTVWINRPRGRGAAVPARRSVPKRAKGAGGKIIPHMLAKIVEEGEGLYSVDLDTKEIESTMLKRTFLSKLVSLGGGRLVTVMTLDNKHFVSGDYTYYKTGTLQTYPTIPPRGNSSTERNVGFSNDNLKKMNIKPGDSLYKRNIWSGMEKANASSGYRANPSDIDVLLFKTNGDRLTNEIVKRVNSSPNHAVLSTFTPAIADVIHTALYNQQGYPNITAALDVASGAITEYIYDNERYLKCFSTTACTTTLDRPCAGMGVIMGNDVLLDLPPKKDIRNEHTWYLWDVNCNILFNERKKNWDSSFNPDGVPRHPGSEIIKYIFTRPNQEQMIDCMTILDILHDFGSDHFDNLNAYFRDPGGPDHVKEFIAKFNNSKTNIKHAEDFIGDIMFPTICTEIIYSVFTANGKPPTYMFTFLENKTKGIAFVVDAAKKIKETAENGSVLRYVLKYVFPFIRSLNAGSEQGLTFAQAQAQAQEPNAMSNNP